MKQRFDERIGCEPKDHPGYMLKTLKGVEQRTIQLVYFMVWRRLLKNKGLSKNQKSFFKLYFQELHVRYYLSVVQGGPYAKASRLIRNYFLSKTNENLRAILGSLNPYNVTIFVHGFRSQIELNALLNKFIKDPEYHKSHLLLNEDRRLVKELKTTININTLVEGLGSALLPYQKIYHSLSLLLHPNPSAIKFYAQAEGDSTSDGTGIFHPKIKRYFHETISDTKTVSTWFSDYIWCFLTCVEHFLFLFDSLKNEFHLDENEKDQHTAVSTAAIMGLHQKEILKAINKAVRENGDPQEALNQVFEKIFKDKK